MRPGAQEFKGKFGEAMDHNEKVLADDEEEGESKGEAAAAQKADKDADESELASAVQSKATLDEGDKSSET